MVIKFKEYDFKSGSLIRVDGDQVFKKNAGDISGANNFGFHQGDGGHFDAYGQVRFKKYWQGHAMVTIKNHSDVETRVQVTDAMNVICVTPESSSVERYIYIHDKQWMAVSNLRLNPEADRDAATKQYVDENMGGFTPGNPVAKNRC